MTPLETRLHIALERDGCDNDAISEAMPELVDAYIELAAKRTPADRIAYVSGREYTLVVTDGGILLTRCLTCITQDDPHR